MNDRHRSRHAHCYHGPVDTAPWLLLLVLTASACEEHGQTPTFLRCSPRWLTVVEECEEPCVDPDLLTTDNSCWRGDSFENAERCQSRRYTESRGQRGCCVFINARVEFVECKAGMPPDAPDFEDAGTSFPD